MAVVFFVKEVIVSEWTKTALTYTSATQVSIPFVAEDMFVISKFLGAINGLWLVGMFP